MKLDPSKKIERIAKRIPREVRLDRLEIARQINQCAEILLDLEETK